MSRPDWKIEFVQKTGYISRGRGRRLVMQTVIEDRTVVIDTASISFGKHTRVADARRVRKWMEATLGSSANAARRAPGHPPPHGTRRASSMLRRCRAAARDPRAQPSEHGPGAESRIPEMSSRDGPRST